MRTRQALSLYKRIIRLHEQKLPQVMKSLGDTYIRKEFKIHMYGMKCSESQFEVFLKTWDNYASKLEESTEVSGSPLTPEQRKLLNDDQKAKLRELRDEVEKL